MFLYTLSSWQDSKITFSYFRLCCSFTLWTCHTDLWGPALVDLVNGFKYYVAFVDHFTRFTLLYLLANKSEVHAKFVQFRAMVETQFNTKIKILKLDWGGGEYPSKSFESLLANHGIIHQISYPYTPQQNGLVERKHKHLIETTITLLS